MTLDEFGEAAIVATMVDRVNETGRFCGETLIQKSVFFLKELFGVPFAAGFRLYYYGPFSFDLEDQLRAMEADSFIKVRPHRFGATYVPGDRYAVLQREYSQTILQCKDPISFVVRELAKRGVGQLEPLATALFLTREDAAASVAERAKRLNAIKPHVELPKALQSVEQIDAWIGQYASAPR